MIYPAEFENKIGFKAVRERLNTLCISEMGKEFVGKMSFSTDVDEIRTYLRLIQDFETLLQDGVPFPVRDYNDLRDDFHHLAIDGTVISLESLFALKPTLSALSYIFKFFNSESSDKVPYLKALAEGISIDNHIFTEINRLIDDKGEIPDNASAELAEIRRDIRRKQSSIDHRMHKILVEAKNSGWTDSTAEMTIRDGRPVIPVRAADKRALRGFIHDESATGQTVYIEPAEIFETNNEIKELEYAERREINKILLAFTKILRPEIPNLIMAWRLLGLLDFIRAKALLSHEYGCVIPEVIDEPMFDWIEARHPLLEEKLKGQGKHITPLDLKLGVHRHFERNEVESRNLQQSDDTEQLNGGDFSVPLRSSRNDERGMSSRNDVGRILVISGPNAGGKSVCLKTIGLLQYMLQCGLAIPVKVDSKCGIFHDMFIDIGDEQSLENDLSTYSSHLINMKALIENGNEHSLFLIDEFGTGTEPQLGGAIAEAILLKMNEKKAFGVVTTHYANLKLLADNHPGIVNGAMLFDTRYLQPLYVMMVGKPGSSFAFEIAKKIGFPQEILDSAAVISGREHLDFDQQLQQLEIEKKEVRKKEYELKVADKLLDEVVTKYKGHLADIEKHKNRLLKEANKEAQALIDKANAKIERTIKEIKEAQAEKQRTKELREELKEMKNDLVKDAEVISKKLKAEEKEEVVAQELRVGDTVCINELEIIGELLAISDTDATVQFGDVRLRTTADKLRKLSKTQAKKAANNPSYLRKSIMNDINEKAQHFNLTLDVRGQRGDEAVDNVAKYIDEATLLSIKEVSILHGKGNGILRKLIREYLSKQSCVQSFNDASLETGGAGVTIITLK
ncbi:MAG: Smr/MutS family protein [Bacteroidales bacterium]|nr:Smr/MutS family protein [Bacteroidales bacterium]